VSWWWVIGIVMAVWFCGALMWPSPTAPIRSSPRRCSKGHAEPVRACTTCRRTPDEHHESCLCQDFQTLCSRCWMKL
jgi:hypothetical protein